jgi:colanic acid/amylovoran biosynthesis glycosyltransferase
MAESDASHRSTPIIAYFFTTFPKSTETFLQREVRAMQRLGARLEIYSFWGGGGDFHGLHVRSFNKWRLLQLIWIIPWVGMTRWDVLGELLRGLFTRKAPGWLNFWENMLGAGFAGCFYHELRRRPIAHVHAAWSGAPATAAYILRKLNGYSYSAGAHAYDIYEHGGDWWLREKLAPALFVHTSTEMGRATLIEYGVEAAKIHCIRRGLDEFPPLKSLRRGRTPLRLICVARLVEKKGLRRQIAMYAAAQKAGVAFEARIVGEGPLRDELAQLIRSQGLADHVTLTGHIPFSRVWEQFAWADVLVHTGIVAPSGDRDGLPNVIPEAMAAGVVVITSPAAATTEAIQHEATGLVADVDDVSEWIEALRRVQTDDLLCGRLRLGARAWVEENFDAHKNAARLHALFQQVVTR